MLTWSTILKKKKIRATPVTLSPGKLFPCTYSFLEQAFVRTHGALTKKTPKTTPKPTQNKKTPPKFSLFQNQVPGRK